MRAFILAAGFGTRMGELTRHTPKPLLPVSGRPLIDYSLFWLYQWGVQEAVINLHYLGEQIEEHLRPFPHFPLRFSREQEILGTAGGLRTGLSLFAEPESSESILLLNPDTLLIPEKSDAPAPFAAADAALYLKPRRAGSKETGFCFEDDPLEKDPLKAAMDQKNPGNSISERRIAPCDESGAHYYIGYSLINPDSLRSLQPGERGELGPLWKESAATGRLQGRLFLGKVLDAGTRDAYEEISSMKILPDSLRDRWEEFLKGW